MPKKYNKVVYDGNILIDLTSDTVSASNMLSGKVAHTADGNTTTGTITTYAWEYDVLPVKPTNLNPAVTYDGNVHTNGYSCPSTVTMTGDNSGTNAGTYTATYTPNTGYTWSDGTTASVSITLLIMSAIAGDKPSNLAPFGVYSGEVIFNGYVCPTNVSVSGDYSGTNVGTYTATYTPNTNYIWSDGTASDVSITLTIGKAQGQCTAPTAINRTYDGRTVALVQAGSSTTGKLWYTVTIGNSTITSQSIPTATDAGTYAVAYLSRGDDNHYDTSEGVVLVSISKATTGDKPPATVTKTYNGTTQNNSYAMPTGVSVMGATEGLDAGSYAAVYSVDTNHLWSDYTFNSACCTLIIEKVSAGDKPSNLTPSASYTGSEITNGYTRPSGILMTGQDRGTDVGTYVANYFPDPNHTWSDGTTGTVTVTLTIAMPTVSRNVNNKVNEGEKIKTNVSKCKKSNN